MTNKSQFFNKAALLGVGSELTTGQIVNKNGSYLSEKLIPFGIETSLQLVVPDDRDLIQKALKFCASQADFIFVTGGLGPTSDDFTREEISKFVEKKLVYDEDTWVHIQKRLTSRGFTVKDIQKQQCYFPETSTLLINNEGTAHGFSLSFIFTDDHQKQIPKTLIVLPGPPREIDSIWNTTLAKWFFVETQEFDKKITKSWDTLGVGESDVALLVEKSIKDSGLSLRNYDLGYRVHLPYVEVKFSYFKSDEKKAHEICEVISNSIKEMTAMTNFQDIAKTFTDHVSQNEFAFYDDVTSGFLHSRLAPQLKKFKNWMWRQSEKPLDSDFFNEEKNFLALIPFDDNFDTNQSLSTQKSKTNSLHKIRVLAEYKNQFLNFEIEAPMKSELMLERRKQYFAEKALIEFVRAIK